MKAMKQWQDVPMPHYFNAIPRDHRGFPVPFSVLESEPGKYDFAVSDPLKWEALLRWRACGICGIVLKEQVWFVGGPTCMKGRFFFDHPMHEECARYALVVCPYIAMPSYSKHQKINDGLFMGQTVPMRKGFPVQVLSTSDNTKPDKFGLATTKAYRGVIVHGDKLMQAADWIAPVQWWKDGAPLQEAA